MRREELCRDHLTVRFVEELSSRDIHYGYHDGPIVWDADSFDKDLPFYPVYRWRGYVSHVPLYLILKKSTFHPNPRAARVAAGEDFKYNPDVVDLDIERIPDRADYTPEITSGDALARRLASAMVQDMEEIGRRAAQDVNLILCGGKDSLNLLLMPWERPVHVLSARPNHPLVREFVKRNGLGYTVHELRDGEDIRLPEEILLNACTNNLEHCRWTGHLRRIARSAGGRCIFWKGQLGAELLTPKWRSYEAQLSTHHDGASPQNIFRSLLHRLRRAYRRLERAADPQGFYRQQLWERGAHWQGAHMALLKEMTGALVLSGYHGRHVADVLRRVDYEAAVTRDLRPDIGRELFGGAVWYPDRNPGPERSHGRSGVSTVERFRAELDDATEEIDVQ